MSKMTISELGVNFISRAEGAKPRLKAKRCMGGKWELSHGVTFYPDGSPVKEGDTITFERHLEMFDHALDRFEAAVRSHLTVEVNQYQFDALVSFAYNVGEETLRISDVLKYTNARRWEDAADAFGNICRATNWEVASGEEGNAYLAEVISYADGKPYWRGKDGQPCQYRRAIRGLLMRRMKEACLYMGADPDAVCADIDEFNIICDRDWFRDKARGWIWRDTIMERVRWNALAARAKQHRLPPPVYVGAARAPIIADEPSVSVRRPPGSEMADGAKFSPAPSVLFASTPPEGNQEMTTLPQGVQMITIETPKPKSLLASTTVLSGALLTILTMPEVMTQIVKLQELYPAGSLVSTVVSAGLLLLNINGRAKAGLASGRPLG